MPRRVDDPIEVTELTPAHFERHAVWESAIDLEHTGSDTLVRPVVSFPVDRLEVWCVGHPDVLVDSIPGEPEFRLTEDEVLASAMATA